MAKNNLIKVEVAYALPTQQWLKSLMLPLGSCVQDAIEQSQILIECPQLADGPLTVGIFCQICTLQQELSDGQRVEIYRELICDPKMARRLRKKK
jgi:putative ubiquitin-RnfH superfamily antitoxin RatB of RatAB toxin-antitoxin module